MDGEQTTAVETTANSDVQTNANVDNTASTETVETTDNSSNEKDNLQEEIAKALEEPETTGKAEPEEQTKDNSQIDCPEKFKNKDGSVNVENVLKSYKEIEPLVQAKADWEKERAELLEAKKQLDSINQQKDEQARQAGYDSLQDMEQTYTIAAIEANEYAKYLQYTDDPEAVRELLVQYANNPTAELMEDIEVEFAPEINKRIAVLADRHRQQYAIEQQKQAETIKMASIEDVIAKSVDANEEIFRYAPFKQLFVNTLQKYGDNFTFDDAKALIDCFEQMKELYKADFEKQTGAKLQNEKATDKLAGINPLNSAQAANPISNAQIDKMSQTELAKEIRKYI